MFTGYTILSTGDIFGTVVTLFVAGYLTAGPWGWPSIFYSTGLCGVLWAVAWLFLGANSPDTHPSISDSEREYIKAAFVSSSDQSSECTLLGYHVGFSKRQSYMQTESPRGYIAQGPSHERLNGRPHIQYLFCKENGVTKGTIYKYWTVTPPSQTSDCFEANNTQLNF
ncbi:hypothetical protein J6590_029320 [Homalodisca vitripennis]|nr:hypothetical protein J6590_029320 [Homalodisca vitripennis]